MRQVVLDTETTGLEPELNHRVIEIGCVELVNRRATGRTFHHYLNPERDVDDGALAVHGISRTDLDGAHACERVVGLTSPPITAGFSRKRGRTGVSV